MYKREREWLVNVFQSHCLTQGERTNSDKHNTMYTNNPISDLKCIRKNHKFFTITLLADTNSVPSLNEFGTSTCIKFLINKAEERIYNIKWTSFSLPVQLGYKRGKLNPVLHYEICNQNNEIQYRSNAPILNFAMIFCKWNSKFIDRDI